MTKLCEYARDYGTNKAELGYTPVYFQVLQGWTPRRLLELGIGGPGLSGGPSEHAASLKMWHAYLPKTEIHGFDIRQDLLISGSRIHSWWADVYDHDSLRRAADYAGGWFDFIVDDCVHDPDVQMGAFDALRDFLTEDGIYAIEDACPYKVPSGNLMDLSIPKGWEMVVAGEGREKVILLASGDNAKERIRGCR